MDNVKEAENLVHLFSVKPKRLTALVPSPSNVSTIQDRILGAKLACEREKIEFTYLDLPVGQKEINEVIAKEVSNGTDSFISLNSTASLHILTALNTAGVRIPEDVRLISFDDSDSFEFMNPPISALRQPISDIGFQAYARIFERIKENKEPGKHFILSCSFIPRGSH